MASSRLGSLAPICVFVIACGGNDVQHIDPSDLAIVNCAPNQKQCQSTAVFYSDGELTLYESQAHVQLPIRAPTEAEKAGLSGAVGPFSRHPWITKADVGVQVTWTLANMDTDPHSVKLLVDPWNEFGKYVPGVSVVGENAVPNLSGIERLFDLPGVGKGDSSRVTGTFTYDDMDELATDFATAIDILKDATLQPMAMAAGGNAMQDDPRVARVNYTFNIQNRAGDSPYTDKYTPKTIPALVGFDLGLQTTEPANIVVEYSLEIVDRNGDRVVPPGDPRPLQKPGDRTFTLGTAGY